MTLPVRAPFGGVVVALADVPDPVFAQEIVGPGLAVRPSGDGDVEVLAPVAGTVGKLHPHAVVLLTDEGAALLVHLGLDTVQLAGEGFTVHVTSGEAVTSGQRLITWNPAAVRAGGRSPVTPIVALETPPEALVPAVAAGTGVAPGDLLFSLP